MNIAHRENIIPLTPQVAAVLLSLASGEKHGYAIADLCRSDSGDKLVMSAGSVYLSLNRLVTQGLIVPAGSAEATSSPFKRKLYKLTTFGRMVLEWETKRLSTFVNLANHRMKQYDGRV